MKNHYNIDIDIEGLKKHYNQDPPFRTLMDFLSEQSADESELAVQALADRMNKAGLSVHYNDARRMLQSLHGWDCGWFKTGRRGWESRFQFIVSMTGLAKAVTGKDSIVSMTPAPKMLAHKFRLRPDLEVSFELPADLTDKEVMRIADFLKTVPFEHADSSKAA